MNEIVMPKLSDTMTEGRLVSWKKRVGEAVRRGEVIAEVETDKANMELESFVDGELLEIKVQEGEMVGVGTVIALVGKAEEKEAGAPQQEAPPPEGRPEAPSPRGEAPAEKQAAAPQQETDAGGYGEAEEAPAKAEPAAASADLPAQAADMVQMEGEKQAPAAPPMPGAEEAQPASQPAEPYRPEMSEQDQPSAASAPNAVPDVSEAGRERAAPVVRRRARELGLDLGEVRGSGPEGRILLQDLEQYEKQPAQPAQQAQQAQPAQQAQQAQQAQRPAGPAGPQLVKGVNAMSRLRAAIAKTVAESWDKIPHFTVTMDIVMDEAESMRRQLKQSGMPVSVNDIIVKAVALALVKFPQMNANYTAEGINFHDEISISIAVGVPDGVLMPVLSGCQRRSLLEISQEGGQLVDRARSGSLSEQQMSGGTFSVSNLGMFGVSSFSAIIHPSQCAVLAVGSVMDIPVVNSGVLGTSKIMKVTLSADHRVVDGAYAAQFLVELKEVLQNPVRLLI